MATSCPPDPVRIVRTLGLPEPSMIAPVHGGGDALLWKVTTDRGTCALRCLREDQRDRLLREVAVLRHLAGTAVPVPAVVAVASDGAAPAYLMEWVEGRTLGAVLLDPGTSAPARDALMREFGSLQAEIHQVPTPDLSSSAGWIGRHTPDLDLRASAAADAPRGDALVHLDFHPFNVMVRADHLVGVLDWANVDVADARFDVARTRALFGMFAGHDPGLVALAEAALSAWQEGYGAGAEPDAAFDEWARAVTRDDLAHRPENRR